MRFLVTIVTFLALSQISVLHAQTAPLPAAGSEQDRGWEAIIEGDADAAVEAFDKAIQAEPKRATLYLGAGLAALLDRREQDAIGFFEKALELDRTLTMARVQLATARYRQRELDTAISLLEEVVADRPGEPQVATTLKRWKEERDLRGSAKD
ncbi:MAG: tetratricopeptide repeat protein [Vicinamibacterales bacterium]